MNFISILRAPFTQIRLLQLENYNLLRFFAQIPRSFGHVEQRTSVTYTAKLLLILTIAFFVCGSFLMLLYAVEPLLVVGALFLSWPLFFVYVAIACSVVYPVDRVARQYITLRAQLRLKKVAPTIIAIAGSYGKTTMKEVVATVARSHLKTLATPASVNTPIGIARTILSSLTPDTKVLVLELGEHYPGDLAELTKLYPPDITILTGINEAHLERFGTIEALTDGICEAALGTKKDGLLILNADNDRLVAALKRYSLSQKIAYFSSHNSPLSPLAAKDTVFHVDGSGYTFTLSEGASALGEYRISILGGYAVGLAIAGVLVGRALGMRDLSIREALASVVPVTHRLEPIRTPTALVIDDSYNGNPDGVRYAIETLAKFSERRKVYVTPGLVEAGAETKRIHEEVGRMLASTADVVVLIASSVTPHIVQGLKEAGYAGEVHTYPSAAEAHAAMATLVKNGDVVLFQNDWPENYT